jgi:CTP:molybdopterin cytidylyltransferase MocA
VRLAFRSGPGPSLLAREVWGDVASLQGDVGARELVERRPELVEQVDMGGDAPVDVDAPEDLEHA